MVCNMVVWLIEMRLFQNSVPLNLLMNPRFPEQNGHIQIGFKHNKAIAHQAQNGGSHPKMMTVDQLIPVGRLDNK